MQEACPNNIVCRNYCVGIVSELLHPLFCLVHYGVVVPEIKYYYSAMVTNELVVLIKALDFPYMVGKSTVCVQYQ